MRLFLIAAAALSAGPSAAQTPPDKRFSPVASNTSIPGYDCRNNSLYHAGSGVQRGPPPRADKLIELPPGQLLLAVERNVGGCREPVLARQEYERVRRGGATAPAR